MVASRTRVRVRMNEGVTVDVRACMCICVCVCVCVSDRALESQGQEVWVFMSQALQLLPDTAPAWRPTILKVLQGPRERLQERQQLGARPHHHLDSCCWAQTHTHPGLDPARAQDTSQTPCTLQGHRPPRAPGPDTGDCH